MKPALASGTRDFGAEEVSKRNYIISVIKNRFEAAGYSPLETPAFEKLSTVMGKYGDEGDKLMFKILNNGLNEKSDDKKEAIRGDFEKMLHTSSSSELITERALRYDLTIPFARYVAMNAAHLDFPFKRYQIQAVWRADRPQKGRYREFWQCDADVVGVRALNYDSDLIVIYDDVFEDLNIPNLEICISNRKVIAGLAEAVGLHDQFTQFTVVLDKLDKVGWEKVEAEMIGLGAIPERLEYLHQLFDNQDSNEDRLLKIRDYLSQSQLGMLGIQEVETILLMTKAIKEDFHCNLIFDPSLARGLDYYTGMIVEVKSKSTQSTGSLGGGGRYDELTSIFGLDDVPGVGISFGLDRIYNLIEELGLFPADVYRRANILIYLDPDLDSTLLMKYLRQWRDKGLDVEVIFDYKKTPKVYKYAENRNIPFVAILGKDDLTNQSIEYKNIIDGQKTKTSLEDLPSSLLS